ncbi:MAG: hypothetical protein V4629_01675 [Pseudomonadota bacterium]
MANLQDENIKETSLQLSELIHPYRCVISHESTHEITKPVANEN